MQRLATCNIIIHANYVAISSIGNSRPFGDRMNSQTGNRLVMDGE